MINIRQSLRLPTLFLSVLFWLGVMYFAFRQPIPDAQYGVLFLGGIIVTYSLNEILDGYDDYHSGSQREGAVTISLMTLIISLTIVTTAYFYRNFTELYTIRIGFANPIDYAMGALVLLVIFYLTYREFGIPFFAVILIALTYGMFGPYFPSVFAHTGLGWERMMQTLVTDIEGVYGTLNRLVATWIALFLLYAGLLRAYGAFDLIIRAAMRTERYLKSGIAQSAIVASMIIGSVNGSATANTGITGSMTIPLMKKAGMRGETAGGIESVASTGGQIVPPIMGAAVFLMASILAIPYLEAMLAGILPAFLFYISLAVAVHYAYERDVGSNAVDVDISAELDMSKSREQLIFDTAKFLVPFIVLVYFIGYLQFTVMTSALYTCLAMIITGVGFPMVQSPSVETAHSVAAQTVDGFYKGMIGLAPIAIIIATINGIVDILMVTGVPGKLSLFLLDISGGIFILALVLAMVICILLGLGMPTSAAYLVVALLVAPALVNQFGMPQLAAHYFVFYAAILATITPPVATGVAVAAGIGGVGFWRTAKEALRIGAPLFIIPYLFAFHPATISATVTSEYLISGVIGIISSVAIVYALNYPPRYSRFDRIGDLAVRATYLILGIFAMIFPDHRARIFALIVLAGIHIARNPPSKETVDRLRTRLPIGS